MATARRQTLRGWITTRGIRAETSGVHRRSARETVRASPQDGQNISRLEIEEFLLDKKKFEVCQIDER
jgi:hypothetical protein